MSENKPLTEQKTLLPVRQHLVTSAVRFLGSVGVKGTPLHSQVEFLRKKGLNTHEIKSALEHANLTTSHSSSRSDRTLWLAVSYWLFPGTRGYGPIELFLKLTRVTLSIALLIYFCHRAVGLILTLFPQLRPRVHKLLARLKNILGYKLEETTETEDQPTEGLILDSFKELQEQNGAYIENSMRNQMQDIEAVRLELEELRAKQESSLKELRTEIKSVRSLFLSTSQFPRPQSPPLNLQSQSGATSSINFTPSGMFHTRSLIPSQPSSATTNLFSPADVQTDNGAQKDKVTPQDAVPEADISETKETT